MPFDRIYADEVQDATQAEVTLFSLACNDNINGLFLAGDNAQAITHGVSFRYRLFARLISYYVSKLAHSHVGISKKKDARLRPLYNALTFLIACGSSSGLRSSA